VYFDLPRIGSKAGAVVLSGPLNPKGTYPKEIAIELATPRNARELHFLTAAAFSTLEHSKAGSITVEFERGEKESMDLIYASNLFVFTDMNAAARNCRVAWKGKTREGAPVFLWDLVWTNRHPDRKIASIKISSMGTEAAPILLGITGIE
jgi:hypothetical protein